MILKKRLITGSRTIPQEAVRIVVGYISGTEDGVQIIVGDASGVDAAVITTCDVSRIPVEVHGAYNKIKHWSTQKNNVHHSCSYLERDKIMAELADECVAFWDGQSTGTKYTFTSAIKLKKPTIVYRFMNDEIVESLIYECGTLCDRITPREIFGHPPSVLC